MIPIEDQVLLCDNIILSKVKDEEYNNQRQEEIMKSFCHCTQDTLVFTRYHYAQLFCSNFESQSAKLLYLAHSDIHHVQCLHIYSNTSNSSVF